MKHLNWRALACGAAMSLAAALPATAGVADFEDVTPGGFAMGDNFSSGGYSFTAQGLFGTVDTAAGYFGGAPTGSTGQFYGAFNDSTLTMANFTANSLHLRGFSFAFIAPVIFAGNAGASAGMLVASGLDEMGNMVQQGWDFGLGDAAGNWAFMNVGVGQLGSMVAAMQSITFAACLYDGLGGCTYSGQNQAQFAIDNIEVPEPATLALVVAALGLIGVSRRKQQSI